MKKAERYEMKVRFIAHDILKNSEDKSTTYSLVIIEDIMPKPELKVLRKLIEKYDELIFAHREFNMDTEREEKILQILTSRYNVVSRF